jgi:hypothetical protein
MSVCGVGKDGVMAFADFGIETLMESSSGCTRKIPKLSPLLFGRRRMDTRHRQFRYSNPAKE